MPMSSKLSLTERRSVAVAAIASIVFAGWFLRSFFILIVFAGVLAYLFSPIHRWLQRRKLKKGGAAALTLLISIFMVLIPLTLIAIFATSQLTTVVGDIATFMKTFDIGEASSKLVDVINGTLDRIPFGDYSVSEDSLISNIQDGLQAVGSYLVDSLSGAVSSVTGLISSLIIYVYLFLAFLTNGDKLVEMFRQLNPLGTKVSDIYLTRASAMVRGTVQGQFIIAVAQGLIAAATFALVGYADLFFVLFVIFTIMSIIPLGAGIVVIPLGIIMIITGNPVGGIIVLVQHFVISSNVDNLLRPILVPKQARLDSALMLLSVFAGIRVFGFAGIIIGPTLMVLVVTTIKVYLEVYRNYAPDEEKLLDHN
jgi:predicted PurR-regulated permease PerM